MSEVKVKNMEDNGTVNILLEANHIDYQNSKTMTLH